MDSAPSPPTKSMRTHRLSEKEYKSAKSKGEDIDLLQENNGSESRSDKERLLHNLSYNLSNEQTAHKDATQAFSKRDHIRVKSYEAGDVSPNRSTIHHNSSTPSPRERPIASSNTFSLEHNTNNQRFPSSDLAQSEHALVFSDSDSETDEDHGLKTVKGSSPYSFDGKHQRFSVDSDINSGINYLTSINGVVNHKNPASFGDIMPPPPPYGVCKSALDMRTRSEYVSP